MNQQQSGCGFWVLAEILAKPIFIIFSLSFFQLWILSSAISTFDIKLCSSLCLINMQCEVNKKLTFQLEAIIVNIYKNIHISPIFDTPMKEQPISINSENKISRVVTVKPKSNHKHTIIWVHGLNQTPEKYLYMFDQPLFDNCKIIAPEAPTRFVSLKSEKNRSWFDIKFRGPTSFTVPFDEAFSTADVLDSYQRVLKPLIYGARQELDAVNKQGKLMMAGFSQGCGMSLHSFFAEKQKIDAVIGFSGYLFPFTKFEKTNRYLRIIHGKSDSLRPWEHVKVTYDNKIDPSLITLVDNTDHEINQAVVKIFHAKVNQYLGK